MTTVHELELPADGQSAADVCLAAPLPTADPVQVRLVARRCAAFSAELGNCERFVSQPDTGASWVGTAAGAFRERLRASAPNLAATGARYDAYAAALTGYAGALDDAVRLPDLARRLQIAQSQAQSAIVAAAQLSFPANTAAPSRQAASGQSGGGRPAADQSTAAAARAAAAAQSAAAQARQAFSQREQADLLALAQQFAAEYNDWAAAVHRCVARIRTADQQDPHHDPHGWASLRHRLSSAASLAGSAVGFTVRQVAGAVEAYAEHPSWRNLSNALGAVGSGLTLIGIALLPVAPELSIVCFAAAAVLSACALGVDSWRKWGEHEQVSAGTIVFDAVGSVPSAGLLRGGRGVATAGLHGWRTAEDAHRLNGFVASAAPVLRDGVRRSTRRPLLLWDPDYQSLTPAHFRSLQFEGWKGLVGRWSAPVFWDGPNALAGLPAAGSGSSPQYVWNHRNQIERDVQQPFASRGRRHGSALDSSATDSSATDSSATDSSARDGSAPAGSARDGGAPVIPP